MNENNEQTHSENMRRDVGRRLREAREAKGLERDAIAAELRLAERLIAALEDDDSEALPPASFVTGYIRSYARLIGLPAEELVSAYGGDEEQAPPILARTKLDKQVRSSDLPVKLVTYGVVIALIALLVVWWTSRNNEMAELPQLPLEIIGAGDNAELSLPDVEEAAEEPPAEPVELPAQEDSESVPGPDAEIQSEPASGATESLVPVEETEPAVTVTEQPAAAVEPEETPEPPPLQAGDPRASLSLSLSDDSWIEVYDAAGRKLIYGLYAGAQVIDEEGEAPFKVFLGNAPAVSVWLNGARFEHAQFKRRSNDTSRFTVGSPDDNR